MPDFIHNQTKPKGKLVSDAKTKVKGEKVVDNKIEVKGEIINKKNKPKNMVS